MKKILSLILVVVSVVGLMIPCFAAGQNDGLEPTFTSYSDIPGVTEQERTAIEALKEKYTSFSYGHLYVTEAFMQTNGIYEGFTIEVCRLLSKLFGIDFVPTVYNEWHQLKGDVDNLVLDFSGEFTHTSERVSIYHMTTPIAGRGMNVYSLVSNPEIITETDMNGMRVGFLGGAVATELIVERYPECYFEAVDVPGFDAAAEMLQSGEIDAFVTDDVADIMFEHYDFIRSAPVFQFAYAPVSITTFNDELEPVISVINRYLDAGGMDTMFELYREGDYRYKMYKLDQSFTDEERAYLEGLTERGESVNVALQHDAYPASFYNTVEERYDGAAYDILAEVSALTGIKFNSDCMPVEKPLSDILDKLKKGEVSMMPQLLYSESRKNDYIWSGISYVTTNYALLSKEDYPNLQPFQIYYATVGTINKSAHEEVFKGLFPGHERTKVYQTGDEGFDALERGEVDLLMLSETMLLVQTNYREKLGYKVNLTFNKTLDTLFGYNKDEVLLRDIVDKAMGFIDIASIEEHWVSRAFDYQRKMVRDAVPLIVVFVILLVTALLVAFTLLLKNKRISHNLEILVTERTNELALQTSALTTVFKSIPDLVFVKDLNLRFTQCNKAFADYFGYSESEIIGKEDSKEFSMSDEDVSRVRAVDMQVINECRTITLEEYITSDNGVALLFETIKTPLMQDGKPVGIMGISRDITQRKAAEETLKLTLDNLDASVYITDIDTGEILFINKRMSEEYGDAECVGKKCWSVLQAGVDERCDFCPVPILQNSDLKDYVWEEYSTVTHKHYKNTDSIITWHDGKLVHMQHSVDITDLKNLQKDLQDASKAKGDFLSRMSHEIRTPLNAVIGMNIIAMNTDDVEKMRNCHEKIDNASKHLLGVINDILDMSKIEADKFELSFSEFDFEKALMNVTNVVNFRVEEKRQNLVVDIGDDIPDFIVGDELRLSQVITNLLSNAVKFTPENGTVILSVEKIADEGSEVTLQVEVTDNGIGISDEQQARLFRSFEQADGSISRKFGGTGLGLSISKRIVELMGGTIWVESEVDKGSKFAFTIKVEKGRQKPAPILNSGINKGNIRILAVDDSEETRVCFSHIMGAHGLPCDTAESGDEALAMIGQSGDKPYNIFFVDWQMPGMNGIELTKKIKEITGGNSVVFMISVADWSTIEKEALGAGVKQFVPKPLFPSLLINAVNECLGVESARAEVEQRGAGELDLKGHFILIAEDVEINREIMSAVLEQTGVEIDYAENGELAVSMFEENPTKYSLILMDIHMPEMDGYEATRVIRALESDRAKKIPIVAMTANVFREDIENCLAAGMNDHVGKPIDMNDLYTKLGKHLM